jgi:hypothetical protein
MKIVKELREWASLLKKMATRIVSTSIFYVRFLGVIAAPAYYKLAGYAAKIRARLSRKKKKQKLPPLPPFHPQTVLRQWDNGEAFRIEDAVAGNICFGQTGSGKSSGVAKHLMYGFLAAGFGALVCCVKKEEKDQIVKWATDCGRADDLIIVDTTAKWRFNFLQHEAKQGAPGGVVLNTVAILEEIANAVAKASGQSTQGGGDKFWQDSLHYLCVHLVSLPVFLGLDVSLPLLRDLLNSAPSSQAQVNDEKWRENSSLWRALKDAGELTLDKSPQVHSDFEHCRNFWLIEFPQIALKTRSIITLTFSTLVQPLIMGVLNQIFCTDTSTNVNHSGSETKNHSSGSSRSEQDRYFIEPQKFTVLKHGGAGNNFIVETVLFKGGNLFRNPIPGDEEFIPYKFLALKQS